MSARDDLLHWANEGLKEWGHDGRDGDITAEELIDAFAHELAEQIRQDAASRWAPNGKGVYAVGVEDALEGQTRGADLIDPEAQKP
jgi:hypothetical protein